MRVIQNTNKKNIHTFEPSKPYGKYASAARTKKIQTHSTAMCATPFNLLLRKKEPQGILVSYLSLSNPQPLKPRKKPFALTFFRFEVFSNLTKHQQLNNNGCSERALRNKPSEESSKNSTFLQFYNKSPLKIVQKVKFTSILRSPLKNVGWLQKFGGEMNVKRVSFVVWAGGGWADCFFLVHTPVPSYPYTRATASITLFVKL